MAEDGLALDWGFNRGAFNQDIELLIFSSGLCGRVTWPSFEPVQRNRKFSFSRPAFASIGLFDAAEGSGWDWRTRLAWRIDGFGSSALKRLLWYVRMRFTECGGGFCSGLGVKSANFNHTRRGVEATIGSLINFFIRSAAMS